MKMLIPLSQGRKLFTFSNRMRNLFLAQAFLM